MDKPTSQSTANGKPLTTFVLTDTNAFREVVQRLTGPSENDGAQGASAAAAAAAKIAGIKRSTSELHERRHYTRPKLEIVKPPFNFKPLTSLTTSQNSSLHPSPVSTPSTFSKLTLQEQENKVESAVYEINSMEEEKAVKERGFTCIYRLVPDKGTQNQNYFVSFDIQ